MLIYVLVGVLFAYAFFKEREALGCDGLFDVITPCDNNNGNAVRGTVPHETDTISTLLNKVEDGVNYRGRFVKWRRNFIFAVLAMLVLMFALYKRYPTEQELVIGVVILFLMMESSDAFFGYHVHNPLKNNVTDSLRYVRDKISN